MVQVLSDRTLKLAKPAHAIRQRIPHVDVCSYSTCKLEYPERRRDLCDSVMDMVQVKKRPYDELSET